MTAAVLIKPPSPTTHLILSKVGAGPSGLSLALALLQNGVSVQIIDKLLLTELARRALVSKILELYKLLGVLPDIQKKGGVVQPLLMYLPGDATKTVEIINPIMLGQDRHEEILCEHLARYGVTVELETELVSVEQFSDRVVSRIIKTHNEGAHSVVRKTLGLTFLGETRKGDNLVVGDIHIKKPLLDRDVWHVWGEPAIKSVSLRPFEIKDDDRYNFICMGRNVDADKMASSREEFIKRFYEISGRTDVEFGDLIWISNFQPNVRIVNSYGSGRAFVTGDSAHVHSPTGGQGLNSGIQDSVNLAWKLALVEKGSAPQSLLDSYSQERIPVIAAMLDKTSELLTKIFKPGGDGQTGWVRGYELRQLSRQSQTVDPYRSGSDGTIRGGDRAPDAPDLVFVNDFSRKTSLFDVFGSSYHTVLIFSGGNTAVLDALKSYPTGAVKSVVIVPQQPTGPILADYVLVDGDGYAYKHYNIAEKVTKVVVVRPDGIIGALVIGVDGMKQYFKGIFI
ncbi:FAD binding domain-containing protein [Desarmillaria tabescens]|uniref:FAD binding domain-containing protein n=1 Tax=Armillaria tabescens TaxID=1929756 RepID=A0AA39TQC4_ARMTA|nr:FAD binding domain-containing protein [Desarmillaria tabescens]KAK0466827.1 FAD binding domain-containing protein [Desarmillaria tabescens]